MSVFDSKEFNAQLAIEDKEDVKRHLTNAYKAIEKEEPIIALDYLKQAISCTKRMWNHMEKSEQQIQKQEQIQQELPEGMEIV